MTTRLQVKITHNDNKITYYSNVFKVENGYSYDKYYHRIDKLIIEYENGASEPQSDSYDIKNIKWFNVEPYTDID